MLVGWPGLVVLIWFVGCLVVLRVASGRGEGDPQACLFDWLVVVEFELGWGGFVFVFCVCVVCCLCSVG